ncbi:MAG TPA: cytochrome P450 [Chloroflexota bacterium]|jgi:cytochrome P450|nr:cytochrome P450 [Chloroflexota bacterium]
MSIPYVALSEDYWRDRGPLLARLYEERGPIVRTSLARADVVFLLGPAANQIVLQTQRHAFSHRRGWDRVFGDAISPPNLLTMDNPEHDWHRRILHPAFAVRRLDDYLPLITRAIDRRLAGWATRPVIDVYEETRVIAFDAAAEAFLGIRPGAELALCRAVFLHGAQQRADEFATLLRRKVMERRAQPIDDALGLLAQARDEQDRPLSEEQILSHADILLIAGYETSASLGAWALYLLARHPDYAERIVEELARADGTYPTPAAMPVLDRALLEAERLYPPVPVAPRGVIEDVAFAGYRLAAGTQVFYSAGATHLLGDVWTAPTTFDPDRFAPRREEHRRVPYALVGFGGGPRLCIGRAFARVELAILVARALRRYRLTVMPGQTLAQRYGVTSRPLHGIRMRAEPRPAHGAR